MNTNVRTVFVCSAARSGSTLLDMLLGQYEGLESCGELNFFGKSLARKERCSCGALVAECGFWSEIIRTVKAEKGVDLLRYPYAMQQWDTRMDNSNADLNQQTRLYLFRRLVRRAVTRARYTPLLHQFVSLPVFLRKGLSNAFYLYNLIRRRRGAQVIIDSSKDVYKAIAAYENDPEGVRVILLIRDGRGVMYSRLYSGVLTGEGPRYAVRQWRKYNLQALTAFRRWIHPQHIKIVRYEDLVDNPRETLDSLIQWIGFQNPKVDPDKIQHIAGGNDGTKMRLKAGVQRDERWRHGLHHEELALFDKIGGRLNRELGYEM